ncbi:uncharacterized protein LOC110973079 isoform X2 [Acanthaster planci]|nr:uncharacterized protein LOC110973079 isoform X2 [Acanthaster planci]XP_022079247.1 uncharacterized protein LOC110973079 isoform X2 [Acanthaster planci]XP_022079248.1 uncharacterized protein LOC110973079 isoform X2 [Acanthaster planci]XP_022079249.1 uncharacterized protein LOC110973079 isoform X2 [Acanthaster planci]
MNMGNLNTLLVAMLAMLLRGTVAGMAEIINILPISGCVGPGDPIVLNCKVRAARNENSTIAFFHGSVLVTNESHPTATVHHYTPLCRLRGSKLRWDIEATLTVPTATQADAGEYSCSLSPRDLRTNNATVLVQRQSEFDLVVSTIRPNLGQQVSVEVRRKCDQTASIEVTRTDAHGVVTVIPHRYQHEANNDKPYVRKSDGWLIIPHFKCEYLGNYTFTVQAVRVFEGIPTSKFVFMDAWCAATCCPQEEDASSEPPEKEGSTRRSTASPHQNPHPMSSENEVDNSLFIAFIVILGVLMIVVPLVVHFWHRRKIQSLKRQLSQIRGSTQLGMEDSDQKV